MSLGILTSAADLATMLGAVVLVALAGHVVRGRVVRVFGEVPHD